MINRWQAIQEETNKIFENAKDFYVPNTLIFILKHFIHWPNDL